MSPEELQRYEDLVAGGMDPDAAKAQVLAERAPQYSPGVAGTPSRKVVVLDNPGDPASSGTEYHYDASGNEIGSRSFDATPIIGQSGATYGDVIGYKRTYSTMIRPTTPSWSAQGPFDQMQQFNQAVTAEATTRKNAYLAAHPEQVDSPALLQSFMVEANKSVSTALNNWERTGKNVQYGPGQAGEYQAWIAAGFSPDQAMQLAFRGAGGGGGQARDWFGEIAARNAGQLAVQKLQNQGQMDKTILDNEYLVAYRAAQQQQAEATAWETKYQKPYEFGRTQALAEDIQAQKVREYTLGLAKAPGDWPTYQAALRGQAPPGIGSEIYQGVSRQIPLPAGLLPGGGYPSANAPDEYGFVPSPGKTLADFPGANPWMTGYGQAPGAPTIAGLQPYEAGPQPPAMAMLNRGEGIRAPFSLPKGFVSVPGLQSQANMSPSELETQLSTFEMQGGYGPDFTDYMRRARTAIGPGLRPGAYSGYGIRG